MVSCIFTLTDDLDAEFPAVAARRLGLDPVPLLCAREVPVPGSLPRVIRALVHYYAEEDHEPRHVYLGEARVAARATSTRHNRPRCADRVRRAHPPDPGLPGRGRLRPRRRRGDAGLQRVVLRAAARGGRGGQRACWPGPTAIPTRPTAPLRRALSDRYGIPPERIALGNGSCDILLAAGEALLEPGAEVVYAWPAFSVYPHLAAASGARAIAGPARRTRTATTSRRWPRRSPSPPGWC